MRGVRNARVCVSQPRRVPRGLAWLRCHRGARPLSFATYRHCAAHRTLCGLHCGAVCLSCRMKRCVLCAPRGGAVCAGPCCGVNVICAKWRRGWAQVDRHSIQELLEQPIPITVESVRHYAPLRERCAGERERARERGREGERERENETVRTYERLSKDRLSSLAAVSVPADWRRRCGARPSTNTSS